MRAFKDKNLTERLQNAAQAKQALLQMFQARPGPDDPIVKERQAKRQAIAAAQKARARARERESAKARAEQERAELEAREEAESATPDTLRAKSGKSRSTIALLAPHF
jgi:hypothetical protein